jgi:hypothetical protein
MAIIDMIPREYWRQMYEELKTVNWSKSTQELETEEARRKRIASAYDETIRRRTLEENREHREQHPITPRGGTKGSKCV